MKLMAFVGSPRKGSNTDILVDHVIAGAASKAAVESEKIHIYDLDIKYCNACGAHTVFQGEKDCPLRDDMASILERMQQADAFIFASPNHGRTISAAMTNLFARMMPLLKMHVERDAQGTIIHAEARPLIKGKKAVSIVSQGDFSPSSSALALMVLDANIRDFHLQKVGEMLSTGNLQRAQVREKAADLALAFAIGERLAMSCA
ncbi:MAG: NAD(P)H-dependent oxidoreductase [Deltaproteobacteria bacterium]|nr:NAD(P)H-dependent oxidoreductase [Deltaproteobacteria bacterium]